MEKLKAVFKSSLFRATFLIGLGASLACLVVGTDVKGYQWAFGWGAIAAIGTAAAVAAALFIPRQEHRRHEVAEHDRRNLYTDILAPVLSAQVIRMHSQLLGKVMILPAEIRQHRGQYPAYLAANPDSFVLDDLEDIGSHLTQHDWEMLTEPARTKLMSLRSLRLSSSSRLRLLHEFPHLGMRSARRAVEYKFPQIMISLQDAHNQCKEVMDALTPDLPDELSEFMHAMNQQDATFSEVGDMGRLFQKGGWNHPPGAY